MTTSGNWVLTISTGLVLLGIGATPVAVTRAQRSDQSGSAQAAPSSITLLPECNQTTPEGLTATARFFAADTGLERPLEAPWGLLESEVRTSPKAVVPRIDLASCLYSFYQGFPSRHRLDDVDSLISDALTLTNAELGGSGQPFRAATPTPERLKGKAAIYPGEAKDDGLTGIVFAELTIAESGKVRDSRIVGSIPALDKAALAAVREWEYAPLRIGGKPTGVTRIVAVKFGEAKVTPADLLGIARFHYLRKEYADAQAALADALPMVQRERVSITPRTPDERLVPPEHFGAGAYRHRAPGVSNPVPVRKPSPPYTRAALDAKVQGAVDFQAVVLADGTVGAIRLIKRMAPPKPEHAAAALGMDVRAAAALKQWHFTPARDRSGSPVPVIVMVGFDLRLH